MQKTKANKQKNPSTILKTKEQERIATTWSCKQTQKINKKTRKEKHTMFLNLGVGKKKSRTHSQIY
jgi:hypothetical protein